MTRHDTKQDEAKANKLLHKSKTMKMLLMLLNIIIIIADKTIEAKQGQIRANYK